MTSRPRTPRRTTYRHGDLRNALIEAGLELARADGPEAVVLREATRRAGVSPNAAYRHFADRSALLREVAQRSLAELATALEHRAADERRDAGEPPADAARARLRALCHGYIGFARTEPGLFRTAFATSRMPEEHHAPAAGESGNTALEHLTAVLDDLAAAGTLPAERRPGAEYFVWSAVHGLASLLIDGPLRGLPAGRDEEVAQRLVAAIERGL
ncbi:TetR/AcrR family transcriptional regulator [Streptomyces sp. RFCAC02]|uniref:TetR/AcrR family transcriptional regulator n=1 Tax=Streptomyces sp. RFCAC02 TaxID=2499143 RepID=UPI00102100EA|nr:TetR/AcrR family transcriptional regulator [Streptomyces sp. RFCAC02]